MYFGINSNLLSFVCQLKQTRLNTEWSLPMGMEKARRKEISIATLHRGPHNLLDHRSQQPCHHVRVGGRTLLKVFVEKPFKRTLREPSCFSNKKLVTEFSSMNTHVKELHITELPPLSVHAVSLR